MVKQIEYELTKSSIRPRSIMTYNDQPVYIAQSLVTDSNRTPHAFKPLYLSEEPQILAPRTLQQFCQITHELAHSLVEVKGCYIL